MTAAEAIEIVARKAIADHKPNPDSWLMSFTPLTLAESIASARMMGRAGDLEGAKYYAHADNFVVDVAYADTGYRAIYEVGPSTPDPICWAD